MIRDYLANAGFTLLNREWCGVRGQYRFRCENNHVASQTGASFMRLVRGQRGPLTCHRCWIEHTVTRLHAIAGQAGGLCLSKRYRGKSAQYRFVCAAGHRFETTAAAVLEDHWCSKCSDMRRAERRRYQGGLEPIQDRARERGGECLSTVYNGRMAKYRFRCGQGHEWEAAAYDVMRKAWCQRCSAERKRIPDGLTQMQAKAERRGGLCLTTTYTGIKYPYLFQCSRGHEWSMLGTIMLNGGWCKVCRTEDRQRQWLETIRAIAAERGGVCVSNVYIDNNTKLEWECAHGHRWWSRPRLITSGHWCAECGFLAQTTREKSRRQRRHEVARAGPGPHFPVTATRKVKLPAKKANSAHGTDSGQATD